MRPIVLSVAGSDPSGGAGIQADLKTIEAAGGRAVTVIAALNVQNSRGVTASHAVAPELVRAQLEALFDDLEIAALKSGLLGSAENVRVLARRLARSPELPLVVDPVLASSGGFPLAPPGYAAALVDELVPLAALCTPNLAELAALSGQSVGQTHDAERAARVLLARGARAVLVKGGHGTGPEALDLLVTPCGTTSFTAPRLDNPHRHGTGCVLASAIATELARGSALEVAVGRAKVLVGEAIRHGRPLGTGRGAVDPLHALHAVGERMGRPVEPGAGPGRLHVITDAALQSRFSHRELALFAAAGGADTVQLREKRALDTAELVALARALREALPADVRLIVDDRVDVAAAAGADGVHLGARDLEPRAARALLGPRALIGGTANDLERARWLDGEPVDYLGVGPVFGTTSKGQPARPLGLAGLGRITATVRKPVIAIGGITPARVGEVLRAGAHGVAVLSAVVLDPDPASRVAAFGAALAHAAREEP